MHPASYIHTEMANFSSQKKYCGRIVVNYTIFSNMSNFHPLEVVYSVSDAQLKVLENSNY